MDDYNFKKRDLFSGPYLLGLLLILAGLFAIVSPAFLESRSSLERSLFIGVVTLVIGMVIIFSYGGVLIDFSGNRMKEYFCIVGFKIGGWVELPKIKTMKLIEVNRKSTNTPNGISPTFSGSVTFYKTFLYADSTNPVLSFDYNRRDRAVKDAEHLATHLEATLEVVFKE